MSQQEPRPLDVGLRPYKILSLFDGISCAQLAIAALGVNNYVYYSSEIDKFARQITLKNFPATKLVGDITKLDSTKKEYNAPLLLIGGSPCQNLSSRGNKKGLKGEKSSLFFEYIRVLNDTKPKYFLLENVGSMSIKNRDIITREIRKVREQSLGSPHARSTSVFGGTSREGLNEPPSGDSKNLKCIKINSSKFVPQTRRRYYWTNIPFRESDLPPQEVNTTVRSLLQERVGDKYYYNDHNKTRSFDVNPYNSNPKADLNIARTLKTQSYTGRAGVDNCYHTTYQPPDKTNLRKLTPIEYERLQGIPDNYTFGLSDTQRYKTIGNSFTVPVIQWFLKYIF